MSFPSKFGKYLLLERVNVGGMAEVFKAKTFGVAGFERVLAIKRILPNLVEDDEFIRMFIDEARIAVQLNHANIVQIYELGKHGEHYYIAMEYIPSRDLRGILDRLRSSGQLMPIPQAAYITAKTAEGLDYAHRRKDPQGSPMNIIHRDVSPQNVLVGYEGEVKVIDFGIAKAANRASKTQAGVLKGKFGYMSPEQVRGLPIDRRSDIFAVGVLLYEMLTGERLFIGESDFSTLERVRNAEVIPPTSFNKKVSPQLEQIVLKTLAREVEDRYQWASELAQDLQGFMADNAGAFNARRLSMAMKEVYSVEVASERSKLEEFLRINPDDVKERGAPQTSTVMPLPRPAVLPVAPASTSARNRSAPAPPPDEEPDEFGEDKTFVIEASVAGMALGQQLTDPHLASRTGGTAKQPVPQKPVTENAASDDVSLYGGNQDSEEDDARTLVGAENPYFKPRQRLEQEDLKPRERSEAPASAPPSRNQPGPSPVDDEPLLAPRAARPTSRTPPPSPRAAYDPVMAAMMEEDAGAAASSLGPMAGRRPDANDRPAQRSEPLSPRAPWSGDVPGTPSLSEITGPQSPPGENTQEAAGSPFAATPSTPVAPAHLLADPSVPAAGWKPLLAALGGSGVLFLAAIVFFAIRLVGSGAQSPAELVLTTAGGRAPAELAVLLDGVVVGKSLPLTVALAAGEHKLEVSGPGMVTVRRAITGTGGSVRHPIFVVVDGASAAVAPPLGAEGTKPETLPPPLQGGWRLSLAAIADDGAPVVGAEVFVNDQALGWTPLEAELDPNLDAFSLKIRKDGFTTNEVAFQRAGRNAIGPATVSLKKTTTTASADPPPSDVAVALVAPPTQKNPEEPRLEPTLASPRPTEPKEPREAKEPKEPKEPKEARERPASTPKQVAEIQLGTSPYAETTIDGRKYGSTPFFGPRKLNLPVGTHKIEFFDKQNNKRYRYQIKLKAPDPNNKVVIQFNKTDPPKVEGQVELKKLD